MADQEEETTANEERVDQPDDEQVDLPEDLPDDPVELKQIAEKAISRLQAATQREAATIAERDRLRESEEEQRTKATYWATDAERLRNEIAQSKTAKPNGKDKSAAKPETDDDDMELADAVISGMKLSEIEARVEKRAEAIARRIVKETTDNLSQQGQVANVLTASYPDLKDSNSALAKATIAEMTKIDQETPGMGDAAKFELATLRSAGRLGIAAKANGNGNGDSKPSDQKERERRRAAQGGPRGTPTQGKGAIVITDADRAEARRMNGGQDVPEDVLKRAKRYEAERTQARA